MRPLAAVLASALFMTFLAAQDCAYPPVVRNATADEVDIRLVYGDGQVLEFSLRPGRAFWNRKRGRRIESIAVSEKGETLLELSREEIEAASEGRDVSRMIWNITPSGIRWSEP